MEDPMLDVLAFIPLSIFWGHSSHSVAMSTPSALLFMHHNEL